MTVHLIGGGWNEAAYGQVYGPFLAQAGPDPAVACIYLDEGDGPEQAARWADALRRTAPCRPEAVLVPIGGSLDASVLDSVDAVLVCGGLTPAYQDAIAEPLAAYLARRPLPYAGFSAGAVIAARRALVGGWLSDGVRVCPEETAEDLEEIEVRPGLGLVEVTVDVHAAQWGTLPRLIEAVARDLTTSGVAIDEDTVLAVDGTEAEVRGLGRVHLVRAGVQGVTVRAYRAGERLRLGQVR
ncbi:Type 1 glutamine amidotransferase-like domain-containing protein [Kitasatospora mediocidica]|uniref:Type 1 glutamine amidotransferase-like domain-containing protein n=1 Tax=Kitasatospora mediocidica TaxID=58352 RepID=UPI000569D4D2|nr:Type 1 glutamine amidotransferase-like domain-containing protein [Kitasatospora mediocidica]